MEEKEEVWKAVKGYEGFYEVSNLGSVKGFARIIRAPHGKRQIEGGIKKITITKKGYAQVSLKANRKNLSAKVHRLVAEAFLPNPNNYPQINHKDENKANNYVHINPDGTIDENKSNLEWCDQTYNNRWGTGYLRRAISNGKKVRCIETGEIFYSMGEAARRIGTDQSSICQVCRGKRPHTKGLHFEYVE